VIQTEGRRNMRFPWEHGEPADTAESGRYPAFVAEAPLHRDYPGWKSHVVRLIHQQCQQSDDRREGGGERG